MLYNSNNYYDFDKTRYNFTRLDFEHVTYWYLLFVHKSCVENWMLPYTGEFDSARYSSEANVITPHGHNPAKIPAFMCALNCTHNHMT